jgi:hypothetical protein
MGAKCLKPRLLRGCSAIRVARERTTPDKGSFHHEQSVAAAKISDRPRRRAGGKSCSSKIADKPDSLSYIEALGSFSGLLGREPGRPDSVLVHDPGSGKAAIEAGVRRFVARLEPNIP